MMDDVRFPPCINLLAPTTTMIRVRINERICRIAIFCTLATSLALSSRQIWCSISDCMLWLDTSTTDHPTFSSISLHRVNLVPPSISKKKRRRRIFALITEPRCYAATPFVLDNALSMLPKPLKVVFFYRQQNEICVQQFLQNSTTLRREKRTGRLVLRNDITMEPNLTGMTKYQPTSWNNVLYTNASWWEDLMRTYGEVVLTLQSDTLICANTSAQSLLKHPWQRVNFLGGVSARMRVASTMAVRDHLNGGLSIRYIPWLLNCIQHYGGVGTQQQHAEDALYHICLDKDSQNQTRLGSSPVSVVDAMAYAADNGNTFCFDWQGKRVCPWGAHKPWSRVVALGRQKEYLELVDYCPGLQELEELQYNVGGKRRTHILKRFKEDRRRYDAFTNKTAFDSLLSKLHRIHL